MSMDKLPLHGHITHVDCDRKAKNCEHTHRRHTIKFEFTFCYTKIECN